MYDAPIYLSLFIFSNEMYTIIFIVDYQEKNDSRYRMPVTILDINVKPSERRNA